MGGRREKKNRKQQKERGEDDGCALVVNAVDHYFGVTEARSVTKQNRERERERVCVRVCVCGGQRPVVEHARAPSHPDLRQCSKHDSIMQCAHRRQSLRR